MLRGFSLSKKYYFNFYASCGSTHKIEFAKQIHKFREHVSRNLYKGRKNVPVGRGFSSVFARKRGFEREAARKTIVFRQPQRSRLLERFYFIHSNVDNSVESYSIFPARISAISSTSCSQSSSVPSVCRKPVPISLTKACPMSI